MQGICPVCNGIMPLDILCSKCGQIMTDLGVLSDYFGPYSPYEEISWPALKSRLESLDPTTCPHVLKCPYCSCFDCELVSRVTL